nr:hypothetical protein [uncultured Cohaesibacter sp.]
MGRTRRTNGAPADDHYAARQPAPERSWLDRLLGNIMLVGSAFALTALVFYLFWYWQGSPSAPQDAYLSTQERKKADEQSASETAKRTQTGQQQAALPLDAKSDDEASSNMQVLLQGPQAGKLVAPPKRNVTPGFALSPYYQAAPLEREQGMPLPPEPEPEPLPEIFRRVAVQTPTKLTLMVSKYREVDVNLARLQASDSKKECWMAGRAAKCDKLGATALKRFIRARSVRCDWIGEDGATNDEKAKEGSDSATCYLGPGINQFKAGEPPVNVTDLASYIVRLGWAMPEEGYYQDEFFEAKQAKRGLFATKATASGSDIIARQKEADALSSSLNAQSQDIGPITAPDLLAGANAGALSIMTPPSEPEEEKELPLPPGFEMR